MKKPHKRLLACQRAMDLVVKIYQITEKFPANETYGLIGQLRRAAVSVPSNITEGAVGRSNAQFRHYLSIAIGSLNEIDTQLEIAHRVGYLSLQDWEDVEALVDECLRLLMVVGKAW